MLYIAPSPYTQCPEELCLTLSILAANSSNYFDSNTTIVFLEGNHTHDSKLVVSNIDGSLMLLTNALGTAAIICSGRASLEFINIISNSFFDSNETDHSEGAIYVCILW